MIKCRVYRWNVVNYNLSVVNHTSLYRLLTQLVYTKMRLTLPSPQVITKTKFLFAIHTTVHKSKLIYWKIKYVGVIWWVFTTSSLNLWNFAYLWEFSLPNSISIFFATLEASKVWYGWGNVHSWQIMIYVVDICCKFHFINKKSTLISEGLFANDAHWKLGFLELLFFKNTSYYLYKIYKQKNPEDRQSISTL